MRIPTTYFGPISWYSRLLRTENWQIDDSECYVKQTTRNHCLIATANGVQKLTVPVEKMKDGGLKIPITQVRLSNHGKWRTEHWNALCTAYGESPFFDYYADDFRPFFEQRDWEFLFDYNMAILQKMLELLGMKDERLRMKDEGQPSSTLNSQLSTLNLKRYWQVYQQRHGFLPDLSIIDLLCCMGPEAILWV